MISGNVLMRAIGARLARQVCRVGIVLLVVTLPAVHGQTASVGDGGPDTLPARFAQAVTLLNEGDPAAAVVAWWAIVAEAPRLPEARVNLGFALLRSRRAHEALLQFDQATALRPRQANAYYGLAIASDALGDRATALGAMRSFVHLARSDDPFVRRARAALWEWQDGVSSGHEDPARVADGGESTSGSPGARPPRPDTGSAP